MLDRLVSDTPAIDVLILERLGAVHVQRKSFIDLAFFPLLRCFLFVPYSRRIRRSRGIDGYASRPLSSGPFVNRVITKRMVSSDLPGTDPSKCVFDTFRIAIAKRLSETLPLSLEQAYSGIDYGKKGEDFTVAVPRFRLPGKVEEIAAKVLEKVGSF